MRVSTVVMLVGAGIVALALGGRRRRSGGGETVPGVVEPPQPQPQPAPPRPPGGWTPLSNSEVTPLLQAKAVEILHSSAPMGSMVPFTHEGRQYGGFVTVHPGTTRAVELWRPA